MAVAGLRISYESPAGALVIDQFFLCFASSSCGGAGHMPSAEARLTTAAGMGSLDVQPVFPVCTPGAGGRLASRAIRVC